MTTAIADAQQRAKERRGHPAERKRFGPGDGRGFHQLVEPSRGGRALVGGLKDLGERCVVRPRGPALFGAFRGEGVQLVQERGRIGEAIGRLLGHHPLDELRQPGRHSWTASRERWRRLVEVLHGDGKRRIAGKRRLGRQACDRR